MKLVLCLSCSFLSPIDFFYVPSRESESCPLLQLQFETIPGDGLLDATAEYNLSTEHFIIRNCYMSRLNKYGSASAFIVKRRTNFREICYCM
jgi:hypothetical protein